MHATRRSLYLGTAAALATLAAWSLAAGAGATPRGARAAGPAQAAPILGAALSILADGTEPWEDRPLTVAGLGTLPGTRGRADPGDDPGPNDGVVRAWDAVIYRASFSVRDAPAADVVADLSLTGPAVWEAGQLAALRLSGCPGGATLSEGGRRLRCAVGRVEAPPAVTVALDLSARVSGAALQGDALAVALTVRSPDGVADPDAANCPLPQPGGCDARAPGVTVSAAPAAELRKFLVNVANTVVDGVAGRQMSWQLDAVLGADGDVRGSSAPVGEPWTLPDWWRIVGPSGRALSMPVRLLRCFDLDGRAAWRCEQPGGPGTPLSVTIERLDVTASLPNGVASALPQVVGRMQVDLWVPEAEVQAAGGDLTFHNCFGTVVGNPGRTLWAPVDGRGQANLGGLQEPPGNNCSFVVLPVPRVVPTPRPPPPRRPPRRPGPPRPPPRITPTPYAVAAKAYTPYTQGAAVTDGSEFSAEVRVQIAGAGAMSGVIACDKWDNSTHLLRDDGVAGVRVWQQRGFSPREPFTDTSRLVVEYATGRWGRMRPASLTVGRTWYVQSTTTCADSAPMPGAGWVTSDAVDFGNQGRGRVDAREVNMVRARFLDAIPAGTTVWLELLYAAERNPPGSWLMNYGAVHWGGGAGTWRSDPCYGAQGASTRRECPVPAAGTKGQPGALGDMLVHVGVPLWLGKRTDPAVPGGSPVINAGQTVAFVLEAATFPRPADPPGPVFPPGAFAPGVVLTDTLPLGLIYEAGSATVASEDLNGNGGLDPGEDRNGNGRLDRDVPFEPALRPGPGAGETTLVWRIGDLPYQRRVPPIRYVARVSRLVRGGSALANQAGLSAANDRPPDCRPGARDLEGGRCAWAQVIVANIAAAQVEKVAPLPLVLPGEPLGYRLALANLTNRPVEWFDAVDLLPRAGEPRSPVTRLSGPLADVQATVLPGGAPLEVWASAADPEALDILGGGERDGLVDPVAAWGQPGAGLGGPDWPCRLADVGGRRCGAIASRGQVTALRLWGPDPKPRSASAPGDSFLPAGGAPRWVDVALSVPGAAPGDLAHNAWGGRFESLPLPVYDAALVRVRAPDTATPTITPTATDTLTPSATPTQAPPTITPTATDRPTGTPTPTPTDTATPWPTATPRPIHRCYIPTILNRPCAGRPVDVALVVDMSTSMLREAGDGGTKQAAVLRAARGFLQHFAPELTGGRVAVVAFNDRAWVVQPLTSDRLALDAALDRLPSWTAEGTRLDLALSVGAGALGRPEPGRWRALVFLTDGMPNRVPTPSGGGSQEDTVLATARALRAGGIAIHTVGYGRADAPDLADRILPWLLTAIAGDPAGYHQTDDAGELADVFLRIAALLGCEGGDGWP